MSDQTTEQEALEAACLEGLIETPCGWNYRPSLGAEAVLASDWLARHDAEVAARAWDEVISLLAARLDWLASDRSVTPTTQWAVGFDAGWRSARHQINDSILNPTVAENVRRWLRESGADA